MHSVTEAAQDATPKYLDVAHAIRSRVLSRDLPPRTRLPNQRRLAREFHTTLMTVRQALAVLEQEGLVQVRHGAGTFVADVGSFQDPIHLASFAEEMERTGVAVETLLVEPPSPSHGGEMGPAPRDALGLVPEAGVVVLGRVRLVGGRPAVYQRSYLPDRVMPWLDSYQAGTPLYAFLRDRAGLVASRSEEVLQARALGDREATYLRCPPGTLAFFSRRTTFDPLGTAFLYDEAFIRGDLVELRIRRAGIREQAFYRIRVRDDSDG